MDEVRIGHAVIVAGIQYKVGQVASFDSDTARRLVGSGYATYTGTPTSPIPVIQVGGNPYPQYVTHQELADALAGVTGGAAAAATIVGIDTDGIPYYDPAIPAASARPMGVDDDAVPFVIPSSSDPLPGGYVPPAPGNLTVSASRSTSWRVRSRVTSSRSTSWRVLAAGAAPPPPPSGVFWEGTGLVGGIPPYSQTDFPSPPANTANEWNSVEMDGNTKALNNLPDLKFVTDLRYNARPGRTVQIILKGRNSTGTAQATKRAQWRANTPYFTPTDDGLDNDVWFGIAYHLGAGYTGDSTGRITGLSASKWHNLGSFRHFTSTDSSFYWTIEDGNLVLRRAVESTWADGLGSDKVPVGPVYLGWNSVVIHARLSRTPTNALRQAWVNGVAGPVQTTANITGTSDIRVRMGPYTDTSYLADRTISFANARLGHSYADVDPDNLT